MYGALRGKNGAVAAVKVLKVFRYSRENGSEYRPIVDVAVIPMNPCTKIQRKIWEFEERRMGESI